MVLLLPLGPMLKLSKSVVYRTCQIPRRCFPWYWTEKEQRSTLIWRAMLPFSEKQNEQIKITAEQNQFAT
eukprot:6489424-Amphidinium_carterae.1